MKERETQREGYIEREEGNETLTEKNSEREGESGEYRKEDN